MNFYRRRLLERFHNWQYSYIHTSIHGEITIHQAIRYFIHEGFIKIINQSGYKLFKNNEFFENVIASAIFHFKDDKHYYMSYPTTNNNNNNDYYQYYQNIIDSDKWNNFWKYWNTLFDNLFFYNEGGFCVQLEYLAWCHINLPISDIHIKYLDDMSSIEDTNTLKKKEIDPYILDDINKNNHHKFIKFEL